MCGRRHGDASRPAPPDRALEWGSERGTVEAKEEVAWRLYLDDSQQAYRKAGRVYSALRGSGDTGCEEVADMHKTLGDVQSYVAERSRRTRTRR